MRDDLPAELKRALDRRDASAVSRLVRTQPAARALLDEPAFPFDSPPIVHFARAGDMEMVETLLALGADPDRRSDWWAGGFHALHCARGAVADRLLEAGATPDACAAAQLDRPEILARLLDESPARVRERGGDGQTPLHFARSRRVVDMLLERGADIDARDVDHRGTPAQWMLERTREAGRFELAGYLVERGGSADVFLAAALGRTDRLESLLGADPTVVDLKTGRGEYGERPPSSFHIYTWTIGQHVSPIQTAGQFEQPDAVDTLTAFASPGDRLIAACLRGHADEVTALLRESPRVVAGLAPEDHRALPDAAWAGNATAVDLMLSIGFDPAAGGQDGGSVLHCAAWQGWAECVRIVLSHDAARGLIEKGDPVHGSTPLGWCCHGSRHCANPDGDYPEVARLLLDAGGRPGFNATDAAEDVLAVLRGRGG